MTTTLSHKIASAQSPAARVQRMRLAIVGFGPRGLQCLETLSRRLDKTTRARLEITVYEAAKHLGAGSVYDPRQPRVLRMNFATQHIDFWKTDANQKTRHETSLIGWLTDHHPELAKSDQYVPRAIVGEYLCECADAVLCRFDKRQLRILHRTVRRIQRAGSHWRITDGLDESSEFDQIVLTTGHEGFRSSAQLDAAPRSAFALPVQSGLSPATVPPASRVLMRGFGLTAIDAILSLTVGRGGSFDYGHAWPRYINSSEEPWRIDVSSRSGRPMLSKPTAAIEPVNKSFWTPFRERLQQLEPKRGAIRFQADLFTVLLDSSAFLLNQDGRHVTSCDVESWYRGWSHYLMAPSAARRAMIQSYGVAIGARRKDFPYAMGESWRQLYPEITSLVSHNGLAPEQWSSFQRVAREMERIAFGPPSESMRWILALIRNGVVRLTTPSATHRMADDLKADDLAYDRVIDAVIASPHQSKPGGPIAALVDTGEIKIDRHTGAVMIEKDGYAVGSEGGIAVFGRATEGWVVGNDTLTRTLHNHIEHWANTLAKTIASEESEHAGSQL